MRNTHWKGQIRESKKKKGGSQTSVAHDQKAKGEIARYRSGHPRGRGPEQRVKKGWGGMERTRFHQREDNLKRAIPESNSLQPGIGGGVTSPFL